MYNAFCAFVKKYNSTRHLLHITIRKWPIFNQSSQFEMGLIYDQNHEILTKISGTKGVFICLWKRSLAIHHSTFKIFFQTIVKVDHIFCFNFLKFIIRIVINNQFVRSVSYLIQKRRSK
jgi:hypothetical protein